MKTKILLSLLFLAFIMSSGCKKEEEDDDTNKKVLVGSFMLKGDSYNIYTTGSEPAGVLQLMHHLSDGYSTGGFTIAGTNTNTGIGAVQLFIEYTANTGISSSYINGDIYNDDHTFDPWLSSYSITSANGSTMITGSEPDGTIDITKNSDGNFTVAFDLVFSDSTTASGTITQDYKVQEMNF
ncbi:MAG: hypothetical protein ACQESZ_09995 [Bacteroidota bacterium]